jgi:hypothetical protein
VTVADADAIRTEAQAIAENLDLDAARESAQDVKP